MATTIIASSRNPSKGLACGIGRTPAIAKARAVDMFLERQRLVRNPNDADRNAIWDDIVSGDLLMTTFG